ncbi:uncharacterized protein LOC108086623 isoform X2 [Drosophila ficusphila]|uniref:uncharacterized protein LOC108086623 isoform X2 n=1 Tax=Drosophila ficusphila TaxID=30025 RepID=UPI001C89675C|nr:uncharacterized protein LOC108086623 isoform X2 [Drosophila ficusphila]
MDELMKQKLPTNLENAGQELTCSVLFTNPKCHPKGNGAGVELNSVAQFVSKTEDLEVDRVINRFSKKSFKKARNLNRSLFEIGHNFENVDGWLNLKQPLKGKMTPVLRYIIEGHLMTTVKIEINKMYFNCHFIVLQAYSSFFKELKQKPLLITLPKDVVSQKAFMLIYKWMLSDKPSLERRYILDIFVAATYLRIDNVLEHCWKFFDEAKYYNEESACVLYVETRNHPALDVVRNVMLTRIQKFLLTFVATKDFLELPLTHLIYLISSSSILFMAVRWLGHNWSQRGEHAERLMSSVCFPQMPLWYLIYLRREEDNKIMLNILSLPEMDRRINEAISGITSRIYEEELAVLEGRAFKKENLSLKPTTTHRIWIRDSLCGYLHWTGCPNTREIRFHHFEEYLTELQQSSPDHWSKVKMKDPSKKFDCCRLRKARLTDPFPVENEKKTTEQPLQNKRLGSLLI